MFAKEIKRKRKRRSPGRAPLRASLTTRIFCFEGQLSLGNSSLQAPEKEAFHVLVAPEFAPLTAPRRRMAAGSPCKEKNRPLSLQNISAASVCASFSVQKNSISPSSPAQKDIQCPSLCQPLLGPRSLPLPETLRRQLSLHCFSLQFGRRVLTQSYDAASPSYLLSFAYCHQEK